MWLVLHLTKGKRKKKKNKTLIVLWFPPLSDFKTNDFCLWLKKINMDNTKEKLLGLPIMVVHVLWGFNRSGSYNHVMTLDITWMKQTSSNAAHKYKYFY